ncbi:MAG: hypothetical protein IJU91_10105 [Selenomonadaceae bacterium]|nr:hypothetical protein [Selenomonadaceae bacterium]
MKAQLEEVRENKFRFGLLAVALLAAIIFAVTDSFERGEEIDLAAPQKISQADNTNTRAVQTQVDSVESLPAETVTATSGNVKAVIGANADEIYIYDPFKNPNPAPEKKVDPPKVEVSAKAEEKISKPVEPVIVIQPAPEVDQTPKPPEVKFVLHGTALGENKVALVQKISEGKVLEMLFLKIGDKLNGKKIADIAENFLTFDDGNRMYFENKE